MKKNKKAFNFKEIILYSVKEATNVPKRFSIVKYWGDKYIITDAKIRNAKAKAIEEGKKKKGEIEIEIEKLPSEIIEIYGVEYNKKLKLEELVKQIIARDKEQEIKEKPQTSK